MDKSNINIQILMDKSNINIQIIKNKSNINIQIINNNLILIYFFMLYINIIINNYRK